MAIPQSFIHDLLARADIVEIIGRYVPLKKGGANFMGLCPFHGEKSPSFSVSPSKQFYHCFGCGKNGNAISFLMEHSAMGFVEAVTDLAQQYGMALPDDDTTPQERARAQEHREKQHTLTTVLEKACDAYRRHLKESPRAVAYFKGRGVSGEVARQFGLGYAPAGWRNLASIFAHYDDPLLVECGLVIAHPEEEGAPEKRYDRFRDRVMFPIRNVKGEIIGFGGRVLGDEKPKYLNSPETPVFSKGRELYGLFEARSAVHTQGYALVTEGYMDVVALAQLGFPNAVATLGTACTADHVQKLFRFTDSVVFSFDGDDAGRRAARKALDAAIPYATDVRKVRFLFLPAEHDPDSYIRTHGQEAFADFVTHATPLSRFLIDSAREGCDLATAEGRAQLAAQARALWTALPQGALKMQLLGELADLIQLTGQELSQLWQAPGHGGAAGSAGAAGGTGAAGSAGGRGMRRREAYADEYPDAYADAGSGFPSSAPPWASRGARRHNSSARRTPRGQPTSRVDHAARLLLGHSELWQALSNEDHALLCELPAPHGTLMTWLEARLHDHGPLPWEALRADLLDHPERDTALRLMADAVTTSAAAPAEAPAADGAPAATLATAAEWEAELRDVLNRLLIDHLKWQETEAIAAAGSDPQALLRYRELYARRLALEKLQTGKVEV